MKKETNLDDVEELKNLLEDANVDTNLWNVEKGRWAAIHFAALNGNGSIVETLLNDTKTNVDAKNEVGRTALHIAAENRKTKAAEILVDRGAMINSTDLDGSTALHIAAFKGDVDMLDMLIKKNAAMNIQNKSGRLAVHLAAINNRKDAMMRLLKEEQDQSALCETLLQLGY